MLSSVRTRKDRSRQSSCHHAALAPASRVHHAVLASRRLFRATLFPISAAVLVACGGSSSNDGEPIEIPTRAVFDLAAGEVPVPNDFLFASQQPADGTMSAGDDDNPVVQGIDALDGASVMAPIDIRFDAPLNTAQTLSASSFVAVQGSIIPNPQQNVFLLPLVYPGGSPLQRLDNEIPSLLSAIQYQQLISAVQAGAPGAVEALTALATPTVRADIITLDGETNQTLRIQPLTPLLPKTRYLIAITNLEDASGDRIEPSISYEFLSDPDSVFATAQAALKPAAEAIQGLESLAAGYFSFMQAVFSGANLPSTAPTQEDIIFSLSFTTTAIEDVLASAAAPERFFEESLTLGVRQSAITKLMDGSYNLQGDISGVSGDNAAFDAAVIQQLFGALTTEGSPAFNAELAPVISSGAASISDFADSPTSLFLLQSAVSEVAVNVTNAGNLPLSVQAAGAVQQITAGIGAAIGAPLTTDQVFQVPAERESSFYRADPAGTFIGVENAPAVVYQGAITLPQYQKVNADTPEDIQAIYTSRWEANEAIAQATGETLGSDRISYSYPFPTKQADLTIPLLATVPAINALKPADGWPVVIFIHGITSDRSASIPMSTALASACIDPVTQAPIPGVPCYASIAIDQPLHGVAARATIDLSADGTITDLLQADANLPNQEKPEELRERHFGFTASAAGTPVAMSDTNPGASGSLFINLSQFDNVRDNLRQMVMDLLNVNASIGAMDVDGDGTSDFDTSKVYLVGHSLGGIAGIPFVAINNLVEDSSFSDLPKVQAASAMLSGGELTRLLSNSPAFAARIQQGLAAASEGVLAPGTSSLETYFSVFQGILDGVDPTPYGDQLSDAKNDTGFLLTEVIGDGGASLPDQTIPNAADERWNIGGNSYGPLNSVVPETGFMIENIAAPLSGTEPMLASFGAVASNDDSLDTPDGDAAVLVTRFTAGDHGTPISGVPSDVFTEMVSQKVRFFTGNGQVNGSIVTNDDVVLQ